MIATKDIIGVTEILDFPHFILDSVSFTARVAMDLNASPVPEEDDDVFEERARVPDYIPPEDRIESGAEIARREREERKRRLKRERPDDSRPVNPSQSPRYDQQFHTKNPKSYDTSRLPPAEDWLADSMIKALSAQRFYELYDKVRVLDYLSMLQPPRV
ncbi:mRNA-capping enzyme [Trifolium pratense]|uniref:mRNA-capping enzyme n=1 Tax=Trifolium pratense TaxID=57577 RepID=A0A2K3NDJ9_TRIPR|nr:mRNA-capping enzyme [Trifolium pratense]